MEDVIMEVYCVDEAAENVVEVIVDDIDDEDADRKGDLSFNAPNRFGVNGKVAKVK